MDDPGLDGEEHAAALRGLARLNALSGAATALFRPLRAISGGRGGLRVLDLASGGGDVTRGLARRARRAGLPLAFEGCDASPRAVGLANARGGLRFFVHDLREGVPRGYDVYVSSLFLHHLAREEAVSLLRGMGEGVGLLVLDLVRCAPGLALAWGVPRVVTRSPVVHADAVRSVRNAFTAAEARELAAEAGLGGATVARRWPCRFLLRWSRP
jgi:SAM-dependent methyltransferase